jgi:hypothetical protein
MEILKYLVSEVNMDVTNVGAFGSYPKFRLVMVGCYSDYSDVRSVAWELYRRVILLRRRNHSLILSSTETLSKADSPVGYHLLKLKLKVEIFWKSLE